MKLGVEVSAEVRVQLLVVVDGWVRKTQLMLYSTQSKVKLKLELSLAIIKMKYLKLSIN